MREHIEFQPDEDQLRKWGELSEDFNPLHFDADFCRDTPFGRRVVFGALALAQAQTCVAARTDSPVSIHVRFVAPMPVGETLAITLDDAESDNGDAGVRVEVRTADGTLAVRGAVA